MQKTILSTADVARLFDVTETTVKRWADVGTLKCQRTPGGHRKFEMRHVVEFAQENNFDPIGTLTHLDSDRQAPLIQMAILRSDFPALSELFVHKALSPDTTDLAAFFSYLYEHKIRLWEIYDLVLRPGMAEIGARWERGEIGVNHEHRASYETLDALARLQAQILIKPPAGGSVLCACLAEESHEIGLRCSSYLFESEGWTVHYLGARTPRGALVDAIAELRPSIVSLSSTIARGEGELLADLRAVRAAADVVGARVVVGGSVPQGASEVRSLVAGAFRSARELLDFIEAEGRERKGGKTVH